QGRYELIGRLGRNSSDRTDPRQRPHDEIGRIVGGRPSRDQSGTHGALDGVATKEPVDAKERSGQDLLGLVSLSPAKASPRTEAVGPVIRTAPAPPGVDRAVVTSIQVHPGERHHAEPLGTGRRWWRGRAGHRRRIARNGRRRIPEKSGERIARAVDESKLERTTRRREEDMAVLVPAPARIGGQTERLPAR